MTSARKFTCINEQGQRLFLRVATVERAEKRARDWLRSGVNPSLKTTWETGDLIDRNGISVRVVARIDPEPPRCTGPGHVWIRPVEVVGGMRENPGCSSKNGGVQVVSACLLCGAERVYQSRAQRPDTGQVMGDSIAYSEDPRYREEVAAYREKLLRERFSHAALAFIEETSADPFEDIARLIHGTITPRRLAIQQKRGAERDRLPGIRDYLGVVVALAERWTS